MSPQELMSAFEAVKAEVAKHGNLVNGQRTASAVRFLEGPLNALVADLEQLEENGAATTPTAAEKAAMAALAEIRSASTTFGLRARDAEKALELARATDAARAAYEITWKRENPARIAAIEAAIDRLIAIPEKGAAALAEIQSITYADGKRDLLDLLSCEEEDRADGYRHVSEPSWALLSIALKSIRSAVFGRVDELKSAFEAAQKAEGAFFAANKRREVLRVPFKLAGGEETEPVDNRFGAYCEDD